MKKILVIRFSAMGDVVLTSPVLRCIKKKYPGCQLHFLVKSKFRETVWYNPHIHHLHTINDHPREVVDQLKAENFDFVVDLQRNRKSAWLRRKLNRPWGTFPKLNLRKFLLTAFKINILPNVHVVDRYFKAVKKMNVVNDQEGLDFFTEPTEKTFEKVPEILSASYVVLVLGATYFTKRIPQQKLEQILDNIQTPVVLLGGSAEKELAFALQKKYPQVTNPVGQTNLFQSALYIKHAQAVITSDTGLMHIAAAYHKKIIAVWGNTVPAFGMGPYMPQQPQNSVSFEVKGLSCRPCSKLGYDQCPKKHFKCMLDQDAKGIASMAEKGF